MTARPVLHAGGPSSRPRQRGCPGDALAAGCWPPRCRSRSGVGWLLGALRLKTCEPDFATAPPLSVPRTSPLRAVQVGLRHCCGRFTRGGAPRLPGWPLGPRSTSTASTRPATTPCLPPPVATTPPPSLCCLKRAPTIVCALRADSRSGSGASGAGARPVSRRCASGRPSLVDRQLPRIGGVAARHQLIFFFCRIRVRDRTVH